MSTDRRSIVGAPGAPAVAGPFSHGMVFQGVLFCSGQTAVDPATGQLMQGGTIGDRVRRCLANVEATCRAAGADLRDAVRVAVYMTDLGAFQEMNAAYGEYFGDSDLPARTTLGVASLPGGADVEIDAFVALPAAA